MLTALLSEKYKVCVYNGSADYGVIREFKANGEILLSTDNGAKGFNLEDAAFVIHYDLPYNTLKMEQRIDRCHRLGQENDVLSLAFIDKNNFADVRKLELVNKRVLVANGVFGITDEVIGGFTENLTTAFEYTTERIRTKEKIEADYRETLIQNKNENKRLVSAAEDMLFTTFSKELADKVNLSPKYIEEKSEEINTALWNIVKCFFEHYNASYDDCRFEIDDINRTITATDYEKLPLLFYYWTGSRNKPYYSLKSYGMARDFKPHYGRITLTSVIGRGIIHELECADSGTLVMDAKAEPCQIGLYTVSLTAAERAVRDYTVLCGITESGEPLTDEQCRNILNLPVKSCKEGEHKSPHWLKSSAKPHKLDRLVPIDEIIKRESEKLSPTLSEEIDKMKLRTKSEKTALNREIDELERQVKSAESECDNVTNDRMKLLTLEKKANLLRREYMKKQESQFFDAMRLDLELERQIKEFTEKEKLTTKITREFVLKVEG